MAECGGRLIGKKVPKGGQTTFWMDVHQRYPRAYADGEASLTTG